MVDVIHILVFHNEMREKEVFMYDRDYFKVWEIAEGIYRIWERPGVSSTLVTGRDEALLIDTGYGFADIREVVEALTNLPCKILNTHCHVDHAGGNFRFE